MWLKEQPEVILVIKCKPETVPTDMFVKAV